MKKILLLIACAILSVSCSKDKEMTTIVKEITLSQTTDLQLVVGQITEAITISGGDEKNFEVKSSTDAVKVSHNGKSFTLTAQHTGEAVITITSAEKTKTLKVNVLKSSIKLSVTSPLEMKIGVSKEVQVTLENAKDFTIENPQKEIISVVKNENKSITITALKEGEATITFVSAGTTFPLMVKVSKRDILVEKIEVINPTISVQLGKSHQIDFSVKPENATNKNITWQSESENIRIVDKDKGIIFVKANAQVKKAVKIIGTAQDGSNVKVEITIYPIVLATSLEITPNGNLEFEVGAEVQFDYQIEPYNADQSIEWISSAPDIASIDNGKVKLLKEGSVTITAKTKDGSELLASTNIEVVRPVQRIVLKNSEITITNRTEKPEISVVLYDRYNKEIETLTGKSTSLRKEKLVWRSKDDSKVTINKNWEVIIGSKMNKGDVVIITGSYLEKDNLLQDTELKVYYK